MSPCDRPRPRRGENGLRVIGAAEEPEPEQFVHLRLPTWRLEQLCVLADSVGIFAKDLIVEWVLERLDEQDPDACAAPVSLVTEHADVEMAEVIPFPVCTPDPASAPPANPVTPN